MRESQAADAAVSANVWPPPKPAAASSAIATSAPLIATTFRSTERTPPVAPPVRAAYEFREANSIGLWTRVRRGLFGVGKPLLED
jgi:hypothetical protein